MFKQEGCNFTLNKFFFSLHRERLLQKEPLGRKLIPFRNRRKLLFEESNLRTNYLYCKNFQIKHRHTEAMDAGFQQQWSCLLFIGAHRYLLIITNYPVYRIPTEKQKKRGIKQTVVKDSCFYLIDMADSRQFINSISYSASSIA